MIGYATFSDSQIERRAETEECVPKRSDIHVVRKSATLTQPSNRMRKMLPLRSKNAHAKADQKHQYDKSEEVYRRTRFAAMSWLFTFAFILLVISIENMKIANRLILSSMSIPLVATSIMVLLNFRTQGLDTWYYTANKLVEFAICIALYKLLHNEPYSLKLLVFLYAQALSAEGSKVCHFFRIIMCAAAMFEYYPNQLSYLVLITSNVDVVMELAKPHFKKQPKKTDTKDEESTKDTPASASDHEAKIGAPRPEDKLQSPSQMALVEAPKISINLPRDSSKSSEQMNDEVLLDAVGPTATTRRGPEASLSKRHVLMSSSGQPIPFRMHSLQHPPVVTREQNQYLEPALAERRDALSPGVHSELNISNLTFKDRQNASPRALSPTTKSGLVKVRQNSALMMDESPLNRDLDNSFTRKAKELNRTISFKPLSSFGDRTEIESKTLSGLAPRLENEFMLMTEQILIACDDNLSILYNNYCDKFYEKIISKLGDQTVNEDQFSVKKGGRLDGFFKPNASNLETDIKTIKNLLRMADCCPTDPKDSDDSKNNKDLGAYVVFQVLDSFRDKMAKTPKMYRRSKTMFLESKLKQISQTNSIDCKFNMVELLGFIRFCVKKIGSQNLETPLIMNFYLCQSTQVCIHLILHNGRYFLFMSLENILQRLQLGSLNSKLNFSYLLIGSLSHELFTPINHLVNATDSILKLIKQEKDISSVLREEVQMVRNITQGVMILVQNMLDFGRFMNRSLSVDIRTFNLKQEADYVAEIFKIKARRKKLDFIVGCPNITVSMDKDKLIGLIYIFLDNAMKYTRQGVVQLQLIEIAESELIRVSVIDTGVGIDESDLQKLSDILGNPYSDLRTTTAAGVGIGFRVAQVLLTYLGGGEMTLDVKSIKGSGTVVTFDVPKKSRTPADRSILVIQSKIDNTKSDKHEDGSEFKDGPDCQKDRKDQRCVTQISLSPIRLRSKYPEEKVQNNAIGSKLVIKQKANPNQVGFGKPLIDQMSPILTGRSIHKTSGRKISVKKLPLGMVDTQELGRDRGGATSPSKSGSPMNLLGAVSPYVTEHAPEKESKDNPREDDTHSPFGGLGEKDISELKTVALVVDDEILNLDFLQHHLESFGVEVYTAFDGELALELCHKLLILNKAVDVIFMDYNMPNMNGDECTKKLKDSRFAPILKDAKIVGLTAHRDEQIRSQCLEAGMDMVEYKPFRYEDIENILLKYNIIQSAESCEEPFS